MLVEFDNENVTDSVNVMDGETSTGDGVIVPDVCMKFKELKDMLEFYKKCAYAIGFPIKKRNSKNEDDGEFRYVTLSCSREGRRIGNTSCSFNLQPTIYMGCKVRISASSDIHGL